MAQKIIQNGESLRLVREALNDNFTELYNNQGGGSGSTNKWLGGNTDPTSDIGSNDDYYLNYLTGDEFHKESDSWVKVGNNKGPQGEQGEPGADGKDGANGADGANGKDGTNGKDGKDGADGSKILNGTTDPSGTEGSDGDYYINTTSGDYFDKESGSWVKLGTLGSGGSGESLYVLPFNPDQDTATLEQIQELEQAVQADKTIIIDKQAEDYTFIERVVISKAELDIVGTIHTINLYYTYANESYRYCFEYDGDTARQGKNTWNLSSGGVKNFNIETEDELVEQIDASRGDFANLYKETVIEFELTQANMTDLDSLVSSTTSYGNAVVYDETTHTYLKKDRITNESGTTEYHYSKGSDGLNFTITSIQALKNSYKFLGNPAYGLILEADGKSVLDISTLTLKGTLNTSSSSYRTGLVGIMNGWIIAVGTSSSYTNEVSKDGGATWTKLSWYGPVYYDSTTGTLYTYISSTLKKTTDLETFEVVVESGNISACKNIIGIKDNKVYYMSSDKQFNVYDVLTNTNTNQFTIIKTDGSTFTLTSSNVKYLSVVENNNAIYALFITSNTNYKAFNGVYKLNDDLTFNMSFSLDSTVYDKVQVLIKQGSIFTLSTGTNSANADANPNIYSGTEVGDSGLNIERALYCLIGPDPTNVLNWVKIKWNK